MVNRRRRLTIVALAGLGALLVAGAGMTLMTVPAIGHVRGEAGDRLVEWAPLCLDDLFGKFVVLRYGTIDVHQSSSPPGRPAWLRGTVVGYSLFRIPVVRLTLSGEVDSRGFDSCYVSQAR